MDDIRHFISTYDWTKDDLQAIIDEAVKLKASPFQASLQNKSVAMLFFNPSLRTKTSFEIGISELSGTAIICSLVRMLGLLSLRTES